MFLLEIIFVLKFEIRYKNFNLILVCRLILFCIFLMAHMWQVLATEFVYHLLRMCFYYFSFREKKLKRIYFSAFYSNFWLIVCFVVNTPTHDYSKQNVEEILKGLESWSYSLLLTLQCPLFCKFLRYEKGLRTVQFIVDKANDHSFQEKGCKNS